MPVEPHQTYVYRITTRNGDQIAAQDSNPVPVMNNVPEIKGVEPNRDTTSYSNGAFGIRVTTAYDYDGDPLRYHFKIAGPETRVSTDPQAREFTVHNLPDGEYTWTVRVEDDFGGADTVTGTVIVDKETPTALFSIKDGALYEKIRLSNDSENWTEYSGGNQTIEWDLGAEDGRKVVYLQAYKPMGETWGPVVERSITLDRTGPEVSNLRIGNKGGEEKVTFNWSGGRDETSGLSGEVNIQRWENGTWITYQTADQKNRIEIPAEGYNTPVKIRLQLMDKVGNLSEWSEPAAGAVRYKIECVQNPGGGDTVFVSGDLVHRDLAVLAHQTYKYRVLTYNSNDEITEGVVDEFTVANAPPHKPVGTAPQGLLKQKDGLMFSFDQSLEMLDPNGDPLTVTYHLSADGEEYDELKTNIPTNLREGVAYWWKAIIDDGYEGGTVVTEPVGFIIDQTAPRITVDNLSTEYAREHRVRIIASDSGSGMETLIINGIQRSDFSSEMIFNTQGTNHLVIEAHDQAGNAAAFAHTYYVDREPPSCTDLHFDLPKENNYYLANNNIIPVVWSAQDPETGVAKFKYTWSGTPDQVKEFSLLGEAGTYVGNIIGDFIDGETYYLHLQAENYLGLSSMITQSPPLLYDHTGPALSISISPLATGILSNGTRATLNLLNN